MKSKTLPSFWQSYRTLDLKIQKQARKAYHLWRQNPFHPSLHFKCIDREKGIWSVRITRKYRAIGILEEDTVTWFWIGSHDNYEQFYS
ncbi:MULTISPECIES: hypothetical protein [unclassified Spirulina]|uniref:ParE family toxin-like protein n=1 Tax=unclassified Spirulina TaxID=2684457 RepID=UPI00194E4DA5|nr:MULTISPECIES: hypothetical protein [Spirulina]MEA5470553.1 hypothetical protein [Spirulina sp. 06S082]